MANWSKQFKQIDTINSGQEYTLNDYVTLDMVNAPLNNTQYLYDVLYTTNTGLIAQVNTNTANITSVTNSLNNLKDHSYTGGNITYRGMITNSGSGIGLEVDRSQPNEYYYRYGNRLYVSDLYTDIDIRRYYGDDSDESIYNFNFNQNGLTLMNSAGQSATLTVEKLQPRYVHNVTYINRQLKHQISIEVISTSSTRVTDLNSLKNLINSKAVSELYSRFKASGSYVLGRTDMYVVSCIFIQSGDVMVRGQSTADFSIMEYEFSRLLSGQILYDDFTDSMYEL